MLLAAAEPLPTIQPVEGSATFRVRCLIDAHTPMRVLALFAQQERVPSRVVIRRGVNWLLMFVRQDDIDAHRAEVIAAKIGSLVAVMDVQHSFNELANQTEA